MIDIKGRAAAHTGSRCIQAAGHQVGDNYSVQANLMIDIGVVPAMAAAFENSTGDLADRMLAALQAAQDSASERRPLVRDGDRSRNHRVSVSHVPVLRYRVVGRSVHAGLGQGHDHRRLACKHPTLR